MIDLDNTQAILTLQGGDKVVTSVESLSHQLEESFTHASKIAFPQEFTQVKNIVVCGMGGSRFPALILKELFKEELSVPYEINDNYTLPGFVNSDTLVILSSYSGTTEEVVHCGKVAKEKGAKLTGVTSGGEVASFLNELNAPAYIFNPTHNPSGQPRIGFGYSVGGHLGILVALGFLKVEETVVQQAIRAATVFFNEYALSTPKTQNPAKLLATQLHERYPYYLVSEFLTGVGNAVANQTNETAKAISSYRVIPELNHHLMEGLKHPEKLHDIATFVFFYSSLYSEPIKKRFSITKEVVEQNNIATVWYELKGKNKLEQVFELMGLGSYASMYLSALYGEDPTVIPYVDYFKKKLKE